MCIRSRKSESEDESPTSLKFHRTFETRYDDRRCWPNGTPNLRETPVYDRGLPDRVTLEDTSLNVTVLRSPLPYFDTSNEPIRVRGLGPVIVCYNINVTFHRFNTSYPDPKLFLLLFPSIPINMSLYCSPPFPVLISSVVGWVYGSQRGVFGNPPTVIRFFRRQVFSVVGPSRTQPLSGSRGRTDDCRETGVET